MIEEIADEKELAFLSELRKYENKWIAILESEDGDMVVGSGKDAVEATNEAEARGFKDTVLFFVRPFDKSFIS
jgi:hypothetical protein